MAVPSHLQRISSHNGPWPLLDAAASKLHELSALSQHAPGALMAAAGLAGAKLALARWPLAERVAVWAGPGNNGGDGLVAARHLLAAGRDVQVHLLADAGHMPADAAQALSAARQAGVRIQDWQAGAVPAADLVIDALLGLGAARAPQGLLAQAIATINLQPCPVLALDLPTGLHPTTGALLGTAAVTATATLALLNLKTGCFTAQGRDCCGELWLADLGHAAVAGTAQLSAKPPAVHRLHASHKGSYGDVAVVGGAQGMAGAAWLAASAALAAGAGRVYVSLLDAGASAPPRLELMTRPAWWLSPSAQLRASTVVAGCGGGQEVAAALPALLAHAGRLVLDADALNAIAGDPALWTLLQHRQAPCLLTPHPLEAARLLACTVAEVQSNRQAAAEELAQRAKATILLKGSGTVLATANTATVINPSGNAALATAGSGDVLAGWCAGLWSTAADQPAMDVAVRAAWQHGDAADRFAALHPHQPLRAAELIEWLARTG